MTKLSVNINKIATLRNSRGGDVPNVVQVAKDVQTIWSDRESPFIPVQMKGILDTRMFWTCDLLYIQNLILKEIQLKNSLIWC